MSNFVKGEGNLESKVWLIGEAPGKNEDETGRPFVGGAGQVLNGMLSEVGILRSSCYVDNVIQYQPPANNFGVYYKDLKGGIPTEELVSAHERIQALALEYKPNVIVALGNEALFALTGKRGITKWRGSIVSLNGIKVIPTYHPAMIMRQYEFRTPSLFDLSKVKKEALSPNFPGIPKDRFIIKPSFEEIMTKLEGLKEEKYLSFDIETAVEIKQILCIGFAWSASDAICVPIFFGDTSFWSVEEEFAIIKAVKSLLEHKPGVQRLIAQNASYDLTFLRYRWGINCVENMWQDSMIAHHCVYPELPKSLAFLVSIYTNHPYHKDMVHGGLNDFYTYNCMDAARTWECAMEIKKEADEFGTWDFYQEHSHKLIAPLLDMQFKGCKIDVELRQKIDENLSIDLDNMQHRLDIAVGYPLNTGSPKQMVTFLYSDLKLPSQYTKRKDAKTGDKKETVSSDDDALEFLIEHFPKAAGILKLVQDIRSVRKLLSTYIRAEIDEDNRMRCEYVIAGSKKKTTAFGGTVTGRLSSRESIFGSGTNLQNIPRGEMVRNLFIPDEGYIFVNADLSQAEARVVAYLAEEERLQAIFEQGGDVHKRNASLIFQKPLESISDKERELGKTLVHAANYGIGVRKFAKTIGQSEDRARELLNTYFAIYPRIKRWHAEVQETLRKTRVLTTPLGRKRMFFGRMNDDLLREAIAYVPQSTVGDILNDGLVRASKNPPDEWYFILQNHDAILMQLPDYTPPMMIHKFIHHYFERPIKINRHMITIPVDIKIGKKWGQLSKLEI